MSTTSQPIRYASTCPTRIHINQGSIFSVGVCMCFCVIQVAALCHNEDSSPLVKTYGYFVTAHIVDTAHDAQGKPYKVEQQFTHFSYPGALPGHTFGFNRHGVVYSLNALTPKLVLCSNRTGAYAAAFGCGWLPTKHKDGLRS